MRIMSSLTLALATGACILFLATWSGAQEAAVKAAATGAEEAPEPAPPAGQSYLGVTKCAACHLDKWQDWKKQQEKHAKALDIVPVKYQKDPICLACHATGYGKAGGFKTTADRGLAGVTCEVCHGPGSQHAETAKPFAKKKLTPEQDKTVRDTIWKVMPHNVCITCHTSRSHKQHPEYIDAKGVRQHAAAAATKKK